MAGRYQRVDSLRGKLQHQLTAHQHREDLVLETEAGPAESAVTPRRRDSRNADKLINQILVTVFRPELPSTLPSHDVSVSPATEQRAAAALRRPAGYRLARRSPHHGCRQLSALGIAERDRRAADGIPADRDHARLGRRLA
jgi:hypothetical protein